MSKEQPFLDLTEIVSHRYIEIDEDDIRQAVATPVRSGCDACGLFTGCKSPKMQPFGENKKHIVIVGEAPGRQEDDRGVPFVGDSGSMLSDALRTVSVQMDRDCIRTNVIQCRPPGNKFPSNKKVQCCAPRLEQQIKDAEPAMIEAQANTPNEAALPAAA